MPRRLDESRYRVAEQRLWDAHGVAPTEHVLPLARTNVAVRVQEVGDGPAVLFVHGANTSGASWAALAARLDGFRRLVLDRPGTGLSEPLTTPLDRDTLPEFAEALLVDVLDALDVRHAHLVATSLGGYIGLRTAAAHPERVDRMVQFSWPVGAPTDWLPPFMRIMSVPGVGRLLASLPASERTVRAIFRRIGHGPSLDDGRITRHDIGCYLALLRHTDTMRNELGPARAFVGPLRGLNRLLLSDEVLARVTAPTYFVWGGNDPFGNAETARQLVARMPDAEYEVMPGAGHAPWLDDLEYTATLVRQFLSK